MTKAPATRRQFLILATASTLPLAEAHANRSLIIVFICEHGYAKSLVAARHFERLARSSGLLLQALSRGVDPGATVPPAIAAGLSADGFSTAGFTPARATPVELERADYVVLIAVDVDVSARTGPTLRWDDVSPLSDNYARARDELIAHDLALLEQIQADEGQQR